MLNRIERLLPELPKPDFEVGYKGLIEVGTRRLALWSPVANHSPDIINTLSRSLLSNDVRELRVIAEGKLDSKNPAHALIAHNLFFFPHEVFLRASPFHGDSWTRDVFGACLTINNPHLEKHFLDTITRQKRSDGHVPTTRLVGGNRIWYFDDESTSLALVWRAKIAQLGLPLEAKEYQTYVDILNWSKNHADEDGFYVTGPGTEKSWLDTFKFDRDTITYNQGVYAASLFAATMLGLPVNGKDLEKAKRAYNHLTYNESGGLQLSKTLPYGDASALFGEFLANLLHQSLLAKEVVLQTRDGLIRDVNGYRIISTEHGGGIDPSKFNRPYERGDYHYAAIWPYFDFINQSVFVHHGLPCDTGLLSQELTMLSQTYNAEYFRTGDAARLRGDYNPRRIHHSWNAACWMIAQQLLSEDEYNLVLGSRHELQMNRSQLFSEESDLPGSTL